MSDMRAQIMPVVANPKQFLFAPFELAIVNIVIAIAIMLLLIGVIKMTPFISLLPLVGGHAFLVVLGTRDQHLTTILQASGKYPSRKRNIARVTVGVKYIP